jgi:subtilisin family serine protease
MAQIAGVLLALPDADNDRRLSFYDSTHIAHAVKYLQELAGDMPLSINISLGTNGHAHDSSSAVARWLDSALATPGRSVCVAAGNAGQEAPQTADDFGYIMGRIHTEGRIPAKDLVQEIEWIVVGNGVADLSENELEIWYGAQDRFDVALKAPGETEWLPTVHPGEYIENLGFADGTTVSIYNELYHPANGSNYIGVYLSPFLKEPIHGVRAGTWLVRLTGHDVRDGRYDGWIERDDPQKLGPLGPQEGWMFPSFFSVQSNVDRSSVSSLACGERIISVANLDDVRGVINVTSSQGPTRDGRLKPEIAAPGTDIVAANGFSPDDEAWIQMSGTSMASPYVAGVVGLMLSVNPKLTAAQIGGIIKRTARPLPSADFTWRNDAGFGRIDPLACIKEAHAVNNRTDVTAGRPQ